MSRSQIIILALLAIAMAAIANLLGNWASGINPDGIMPHPSAEGTEAAEQDLSAQPRDAYRFGLSMGLLGTGLLYCCVAMGLLIQARSRGKSAGMFIYCVAALAAIGFALSYLLDDYFY